MAKKAASKPRKKAPEKLKLSTEERDQVISEVAGQDTLNIIHYLKGKENISEFIIAQELKEEINYIRNKLYRLLQVNLVRFTRKKDKQKGWYIYYWTLNLPHVRYLYYDLKRKKLEALKDRLKREESNFFFICKNRCIRLDFEQAISFDYKCPECGELLYQEDNEEIRSKIEDEIEGLAKEIENLEEVAR